MWHESEHFTLGTTEMFWEAFECWAARVTGREESIKKDNKSLDHNLPNIMRNHVDEQVWPALTQRPHMTAPTHAWRCLAPRCSRLAGAWYSVLLADQSEEPRSEVAAD